MAALWLCADLRSDGVTVGTGRSGLLRGRLLSTAEAPLPPHPEGDPVSESAAAVRVVAGALAAHARETGGRPEGVLLALPDRWFKIGLVTPKAARGKVRLGEYASWKLQADWNLEEERTFHDWQSVRGRRGEPAALLLVAAERDVVGAASAFGEAAGVPVAMCVPRALAAWNRMAHSLSGGVSATLLRDGDSFTFFGADRGRLVYVRSRRCESPAERETEERETHSHFLESVGAGGEETPPAEWGGGHTVLEGLLAHPMVTGFFA